ncbi:MAG: TIGR00730 family Rossman fold protein [Paludibacteraceae bacterium]|nr:TIGR00730 family Rossman fold protein [Paludibacteraceae bacterium]
MNIAVYCSAKSQIPAAYLQMGEEVGKKIAETGHTLVFGGATGGLMTQVSEAYHNVQPSHLIGVITQGIADSGRQSDICDELHVVSSMSERKQRMRDIADCFICLPGSYGTLDEMMDAIASATVNEHRKPCVILNFNGFYEPLKKQIQLMKSMLFIPAQEHYSPIFVDTIEELFVTLNTFPL